MSVKFLNVTMIRPEYSTKVFRTYYLYLKNHSSENIFEDILKELNMSLDYMLTDGNWVSSEFAESFINLLTAKTGDEDIARSAAKYTIHPDAANPLEFALVKAMPLHLLFMLAPFTTKKVNRQSALTLTKISFSEVEYKLTPSNSHKPHHKSICQSFIGTFESLPTIYNIDQIKVEEAECVHKGGDYCRINIKFVRKTAHLKIIVSLSLATLATSIICKIFLNLDLPTNVLKNWSAGVTLLFTISSVLTVSVGLKVWEIIKHQVLVLEQDRIKNLELHQSKEKLDRRYKEANMLRELSLSLVDITTPDAVIESCIQQLETRFGFQKTLVLMVDLQNKKLKTFSQRGFAGAAHKIQKLMFDFPGKISEPQLFANILTSGKTTLIGDVAEYKLKLKEKNRKLLDELAVTSMVVAPIQDFELKYGLLAVGSVDGQRLLTEDDRNLLENIVQMLSLYFKNSTAFAREQVLRTVFQKYVPSEVLTSLEVDSSDGGKFIRPQETVLTSLFIDLRGFTSLTESYSVDQIFDVLNRYLNFGTNIIAQHGGIIDKLVGDEIVAFFVDSSNSNENHAVRALKATAQLLTELEEFNLELETLGFAALSFGIGLNSGIALVGSMGGDIRLNYTAIGDVINTASRLQDLCKVFSNEINGSSIAILSESTVQFAPQFKHLFINLGMQKIRGKQNDCLAFLLNSEQALGVLEKIAFNDFEDIKKTMLRAAGL